MLEIRDRLEAPAPPQTSLTLPFAMRQKSRLRTRLDDGREVGLFLPRGSILRQGDLLRAADGSIVEVNAAAERVCAAYSDDPVLLARAAYHLGNRHVQLQIGSAWLRYQHDHVLDDMLRRLGLGVSVEHAPFEPEAGAYLAVHTHSH